MNRLLSKHWPLALTLLLGVAAGLFWAVGYYQVLAYQEQFQLFLLGGDYFCQCLSQPGGLARWMGEFLVQFYNNYIFGAIVLALLYMLIHVVSSRVTGFKVLSLIPVLLLWYVMGDENVLLPFGVALFLALLACWGIKALARSRWAMAVVVLAMPLLYWLIGPMALLVALYMAVVLPLSKEHRFFNLGAGLLALALVVATMVACSHCLPYPPERMFYGLSYYRVPMVLPVFFVIIPLVVVLLSALSRLPFCQSASLRMQALALAAVVVLGIVLVPRGFDAKRCELMDYDYLVRTGQWKAIIAKAERQMPDLPMSVSATNLALAMENQLGERAFQFYQRGTQGLLPSFERNFATTQLLGEIYFRMGMVNTAQRLAFEAMEALPNYAKSARAVRRLAETNLINGQYDVARKYLKMLEKTLFYAKWARQMMQLLGDEAKIDAHPLYGYLRRVRLQEDFLFSERETDRMCGQLFLHNQQNQVAMQYLLMWPLLNRDINTFMQYVPVVQQRVQYNPRHVQEAICYAFGQRQQRPPRELVGDVVAQHFLQFANAFNRGGSQNPSQLQSFKNTLWYYLVNSQ